jgi:hypothetical protein
MSRNGKSGYSAIDGPTLTHVPLCPLPRGKPRLFSASAAASSPFSSETGISVAGNARCAKACSSAVAGFSPFAPSSFDGLAALSFARCCPSAVGISPSPTFSAWTPPELRAAKPATIAPMESSATKRTAEAIRRCFLLISLPWSVRDPVSDPLTRPR